MKYVVLDKGMLPDVKTYRVYIYKCVLTSGQVVYKIGCTRNANNKRKSHLKQELAHYAVLWTSIGLEYDCIVANKQAETIVHRFAKECKYPVFDKAREWYIFNERELSLVKWFIKYVSEISVFDLAHDPICRLASYDED